MIASSAITSYLNARRPYWCVLLGLAWSAASAQSVESPAEASSSAGIELQSSRKLVETVGDQQRQQAPVFVLGQKLTGRPDLDLEVQGDAELRKPGTVIKADTLRYDAEQDKAYATGHVRVNRNGNVIQGSALELEVEAFKGHFNDVQYEFLQSQGHGQATQAEFVDEHHSVVRNATYTTCTRKPGPSWLPDWFFQAESMSFDTQNDEGVSEGAYLVFKDVPILPVPPLSFPLTGKRKTGLLPPTMGLDSIDGVEYSQPYYWNIAPNRDMTITPSIMTARGLDVGTEFRYLEPGYKGNVAINFMSTDKLRDMERWSLAWKQTGEFALGSGQMSYSLDLNRVSDSYYWSDFTRASGYFTQRLLPTDWNAAWKSGEWTLSARVLKYQTLQVPDSIITPPYDREPEFGVSYESSSSSGWVWSWQADATHFVSDTRLTGQPNAQRVYSLGQLSYPWRSAAGHVIPKWQWHSTAYQFDSPLSDGSQTAGVTVPTFSLDVGQVYQRNTQWGGHALRQTLEPRLFYVRTPYRNQSMLPNYDTAANDFSFASIWTENSYLGHDKIADNDLLTAGASTRFIDADSGLQWARFGIAQRYRLQEQRVTLTSTDETAKAGYSDVLAGADLNLSERWMLTSTWQYNPKTDLSVRSIVGARYSPEPYKVLNVAHRYQRDSSEQIDVSWQWPLNQGSAEPGVLTTLPAGRYYTVGRVNYSIDESRTVYGLFGLEYDAGCWIGRIVVARTQTSATSFTQGVKFELEFVGFSRVGVSPLQTLKTNIGGYQPLRAESSSSPSRFTNYD
ncbi:LPS-assembly protein LptD [Curvibacter sp. CHRR-16]|uniref:LPS-assembly protein LptD n=1 Tax=Curvibacter sp. CHRR-16 TaxID=2835872 RepID=UPI001BD9CF67|nr:LPS assembly protein LptD [Curvibacter sp. CHRR-16]MBT0570346.1 LPS-assembly protein LptD [Curvibacter sp. CHRR-16]